MRRSRHSSRLFNEAIQRQVWYDRDEMEMKLKRYPERKNELLQAWDAADTLALAHLAETPELVRGRRVLVLNDAFGALSVPLLEYGAADLDVYTDSYCARQAIRLNSQNRLEVFSSLEALRGPYDLVLVRIPKNLSFFADQLARLSAHLAPQAKLIAPVMVKYQVDQAFDLIGKFVGDTSTSLAQKKARLIFADFTRSPTRSEYPKEVKIEGFSVPFLHHSNLFSREKLDIGTRFLLEHLPGDLSGRVLDLGCGNGILGIAAKQKNSGLDLVFTDDSFMAIESARANVARHLPDDRTAEFHFTNGFENGQAESVDYVLCNPPFHQGTTTFDAIAEQMFRDAHRVLRAGGRLRVVGNGHLHYPKVLERIFGQSRQITANAKFVIVDAVALKRATEYRP